MRKESAVYAFVAQASQHHQISELVARPARMVPDNFHSWHSERTWAGRVLRTDTAVHGAAIDVPAAADATTTRLGALGLTDRERDVAELAVSGYSYAQIARELFVAQTTVGYHLSNIYAKCGVRSRHELTELARSRDVATSHR
jgi:DNA-binding CsgD family transcriptional regulator